MTTMISPITTSGLSSLRKAHLTRVINKQKDVWSAMPATCNMSGACITIIGWIEIVWEMPMSISPNTNESTIIPLVEQIGRRRRPKNPSMSWNKWLRLKKNKKGLTKIGNKCRNRSNRRREEDRATRRAIRATTTNQGTGRSPLTNIETPIKIEKTGKEATRSTGLNDV